MPKIANPEQPKGSALGTYLASLRLAKGFTLRHVEEATGKEVSNAYLSQLEHGYISKPSPNILHSLASIYGVPYETLMEKAGYITASRSRTEGEKHGRAAAYSIENLTEEEEDELMKYLAWYRSRRKAIEKSGR